MSEKRELNELSKKNVSPPSANRCDGAVFQAFSMSVFSRSGDAEPQNRGPKPVRKNRELTDLSTKNVCPRVANRCDGAAFQAFSNSVFSRSGDVESKNRGLVSVRKNRELNDLSKKTRASTGRESMRRCSVSSLFDVCVFAFGRC